MDTCMHACMDRWMQAYMDEWIKGWIDEQLDGCMNRALFSWGCLLQQSHRSWGKRRREILRKLGVKNSGNTRNYFENFQKALKQCFLTF